MCSFGNGWRLTGDSACVPVLLDGARALATRFDGRVGAIRSWDKWRGRQGWEFRVIIDNLMNLELLCLASTLTGDTTFRHMAIVHARTTLQHHYRPDGSSFHVVDFDASGYPRAKGTHQGFDSQSAWARGQAWGLYGYTMLYRETGQADFLRQAERIAAYWMSHPRMPTDKVPYWDFDAPDIPRAPRDVSAAAVAASALLELAALTRNAAYHQWAVHSLRSLAASPYLAPVGTNQYFLLSHSVGHLPAASEVDVPLIYADYYFLEALARLQTKPLPLDKRERKTYSGPRQD